MLIFYAVAFCVIILTGSHSYAQVNVEPERAVLNEGDRTELLCRYGRTINYCRIEIPGEKVLNLSPDWTTKSPGFNYYGAGLVAGQCGVSIEHVKATNNGQVKCSLGVEGDEFSNTIELMVALRPQQPIIELISKPNREEHFSQGDLFRARCIVRDGRPPANITWFMDDFPAQKPVEQLQFIDSQVGNNITLSTTVQEIHWRVTAADDQRKLICRSHHQTDRENVPPQEGAYLMRVRFPPVEQPEVLVYGLYLDRTALVNITIRSNPAPRVEWTVNNGVIQQSAQEGRFSVYEPQYLGQGYYNVTLAIAGLTLEDTTKSYQLRASNELGSTDYQVRISSSSTPPTAGLDIGAIVGIVVAVAVLIVVVLLILFARTTGRWCFGERPIKTAAKEIKTGQQNVALLETASNLPIPSDKANSSSPVVPRRTRPDGEFNSFEYDTDRESSRHSRTSMPLNTIIGSSGGRYSHKSSSNEEVDKAELSPLGNQSSIPESRFSRWIPKDQREILEKQAKLLASRIQPRTPERNLINTPETSNIPVTQGLPYAGTSPTAKAPPIETEISNTECAEIQITTTETASVLPDNSAVDIYHSATDTPAAKKSKRMPSLSSLLRQLNGLDSCKRKHQPEEQRHNNIACSDQVVDADQLNEISDAIPIEPKEDAQLVYADLVLKPAQNNKGSLYTDTSTNRQKTETAVAAHPFQSQPPASNTPTEYAEIVYFKEASGNSA